MIHVESGYANATDGRRLHRIEVPKDKKNNTPIIPDGDYFVLVRRKSCVIIAKNMDEKIKFPDMGKFIPSADPVKKTTIGEEYRTPVDLSATKLIVEFGPKFGVIDREYLKELKGVWEVQIFNNETPGAVMFTQSKKMALIMPLRYE
jgi:hypothetical protein